MCKPESLIVNWYGKDTYSWIKTCNTDELVENKCDSVRTSIINDMHQKYQLALADLRYD